MDVCKRHSMIHGPNHSFDRQVESQAMSKTCETPQSNDSLLCFVHQQLGQLILGVAGSQDFMQPLSYEAVSDQCSCCDNCALSFLE